jgi:hypothetical protein
VVGVADVPVTGGAGSGATPWTSADADTRVPIAFVGAGVDPRSRLDGDATLDRVAPTLTRILGVDWTFPDVHAGEPFPGIANGRPPRLVVELVWTGGGSAALEADAHAAAAWERATRGGSAATLDGATGSLPLDPVATLTTIGTGGTPSQHGITGGLIRTGSGDVVRPWSQSAPTSVIAALPDDLVDQAPDTRVGAVLPSRTDRGLVGGTWYGTGDIAEVAIERGRPERAVASMVARGFGADRTPDVIGVVVDGSPRAFGRALEVIVPRVRRAVPQTTVVLAATGARSSRGSVTAAAVAQHVNAAVGSSAPIVAAATPGGLLLDQAVLAADGRSSSSAAQAMLTMRDGGGRPVFRDAFAGFAVSFARYC